MTTQVLVKQSTAGLTRKKLWQDTANAGILIAALVVGHVFEVTVPPGVEAAVTLAVGGWIGYQVKERA